MTLAIIVRAFGQTRHHWSFSLRRTRPGQLCIPRVARSSVWRTWMRSSSSPPGRARDFRELAEKLAGQNYSSKYLDRLRAQVNTEQQMEDVFTEIHGEMAAALGRAGDKVNFMLLKLELHEKNGGADEEFHAIRREAIKAREELVIQRIACGFRFKAQEFVNKHYPIPPPRGCEGSVSLEEQNHQWRESMADVTSGAALHRWRKARARSR